MDLTQKILDYQAGKYTWREISIDLYEATRVFVRCKGASDEAAHELFYYSQSRLKYCAHRFLDKGFRFSTYLRRALEWQWRSWQQRNTVALAAERRANEASLVMGYQHTMQVVSAHNPQAVTEQVVWMRPDADHDALAGDQSHEPASHGSIRTFKGLRLIHRRLVVIALRNCLAMDDARCHRLASHIAADPLWLFGMVDDLRGRLIQAAPPGKGQRRMYSRRKHPYHKEIAEVLHIPKGSVDSILHNSRLHLFKA